MKAEDVLEKIIITFVITAVFSGVIGIGFMVAGQETIGIYMILPLLAIITLLVLFAFIGIVVNIWKNKG